MRAINALLLLMVVVLLISLMVILAWARPQDDGVLYGGSLSYRFMCRYNSGFFFRHPLALPYKYYWRVEPGVSFPCSLQFDPFLRMQKYGKRYAFVISLEEIPETIPSLWRETLAFADAHVSGDGHLTMFAENGEYSMCHYWSNFEIADLDFFRSDQYLAYFDHLDRAGGFFCAPSTRPSGFRMRGASAHPTAARGCVYCWQ